MMIRSVKMHLSPGSASAAVRLKAVVLLLLLLLLLFFHCLLLLELCVEEGCYMYAFGLGVVMY